jgi:hypothetical protein
MNKYIVKYGIGTLPKLMTEKQALNYGNKIIPSDLKKAGFITSLFKTETHLRINFSKGY